MRVFQSRMANLCRRMRPHERAAAVEKLVEEKRYALLAMRDRRETARYAERYLRRLRRAARGPPAQLG